MSKLHKITLGFAVQVFDTDTNSFISQEFVASDDTTYETPEGEAILGCHCPDEFREHLDIEVIQPNDNSQAKLNEIRSAIEAYAGDSLNLLVDITHNLDTNC